MYISINGLGLCSPLGEDNNLFFKNIFAGETSWKNVSRFKKRWRIPEFVACAFEYPHTLEEVVERALYNACKDSDLENKSELTLVCFATSNGMNENALDTNISKDSLGKKTSNLYFISHTIKKYFSNFKVICFTTACASGGDAIAYAYRQIKAKKFKRALIIGADILAPSSVGGFMSLGAESKNGCQPFSKYRDGMSFGEGAACILLEPFHTKKSYAEILGLGQSNDDFHITAPDPKGEGLSKAINMALKSAKLEPTDIDYINAHGTGTKLNDSMEVNALKSVFKYSMPKVSSTKSQIGHTLGAAGVFEAAVTAKAVKDGIFPPNIISRKDVMDNELNLITSPNISGDINYALSNSSGIGGNNVSIVFRKVKNLND